MSVETATIPVVVTGSEKPAEVVVETPKVPDKFMKDGKPDHDAVLAAYLALEKKQSTTPAPAEKPAEKVPDKAPEKPAEKPVEETSGFKAYEDEFAKDGKLSDASYEALSKKTGMPKADIDSYIKFRQSQSTAFETAILEPVGGAEGWKTLSAWASTNLKDDEINTINTALTDVKNPGAAKMILAGLKARMETATGRAPNLVNGGVLNSNTLPYQTMSEAQKALRDPRYRTDASFRKLHDQRMSASTFIETK